MQNITVRMTAVRKWDEEAGFDFAHGMPRDFFLLPRGSGTGTGTAGTTVVGKLLRSPRGKYI